MVVINIVILDVDNMDILNQRTFECIKYILQLSKKGKFKVGSIMAQAGMLNYNLDGVIKWLEQNQYIQPYNRDEILKNQITSDTEEYELIDVEGLFNIFSLRRNIKDHLVHSIQSNAYSFSLNL